MLSNNNLPLALIYCDGNKEIGFGHIRRATALAEYLSKVNIPAVLIGLSNSAVSLLPKVNFSTQKVRIAIFDSMFGVGDLISTYQNKGIKTVTLDWFGEIVPDYNIVVFPHLEVKALSKSFVGFENIIIRDEILSLQRVPVSKSFKNVLICLGGGDLLNQSEIAAEILAKNGYNITIIKGPLANSISVKSKFPILENPSNFPEILNSCDWAVTNGGGCLFEALYLGKPVFVLPQTILENTITTDVYNCNAILGYGINNILNINMNIFETVSENGMRLIDGNGLSRVANIIKELL